MLNVRAALCGICALVALVSRAQALVDDPFSSETQPAASLVAPFDASGSYVTYLEVSQVPGGSTLATHWVFWSETCTHLVDVWICLTAGDTVVVDSSAIRAVDEQNHPLGPEADLSGERGFVVVTAYDGSGGCLGSAATEPVDDVITGAYTIANTATDAAFGGDMVGFGLDSSGSYVNLPDLTLEWLDLQTFDPTTLGDSSVMLLALQEAAGNGATGDVEIGPLVGVSANAEIFDNLEIRVSLPEVAVSCSLFGPLVGTLIPPAITPGSAGFVRLFRPQVGGTEIGVHTWLLVVHGMAVGPFGTTTTGRYPLVPGPSPTPTGTPTPTRTPAATPTTRRPPTPTAFPSITPTPAGSPTPTALPTISPTPAVTPSGQATATPTPTSGPTTTPTPEPTPSVGPILTPTPSPTPSASPTPTPSPTSTPTPSPSPTPTPSPSPTPEPTPTSGPIITPTPEPTPTGGPIVTPTPEPTPTTGPIITPTPEPTPTGGPIVTPTPEPTPTTGPIITPTPTATPQFCTYTQGGWGTECRGNNPGCTRDRGFPGAFPSGLTIGGAMASARWTTSAAIQGYLPAGGPPGALSGTLTNPTKTSAGVLGGQLVAAKLNVGILGLSTDLVFVFDPECDAPTALVGSSIGDVIGLTDAALSSGSPSMGLSFSDLAKALTLVNENYDECRNLGCLAFPAPPPPPEEEPELRGRRPRPLRSDVLRRGRIGWRGGARTGAP